MLGIQLGLGLGLGLGSGLDRACRRRIVIELKAKLYRSHD